MKQEYAQCPRFEWALVMAILLTAGLVAYGILTTVHKSKAAPAAHGKSWQQQEANQADTALEVPAAPRIESAADLDTALQVLDHANLEAASHDERELTNQVNF